MAELVDAKELASVEASVTPLEVLRALLFAYTAGDWAQFADERGPAVYAVRDAENDNL